MVSKTNIQSDSKGQAMIEFALIILVLAFIIFVIIEGARILQANLTAQNAARAAGRYAITGQFDPGCLADSPPCSDPRVESIKAVAREELSGLPLADGAAYEDPNYYLIEVFGADENGNQIADYAGVPGGVVIIRVTYRVGTVTPMVQPIAETVRVIGQVVMINERYAQVSNTSGGDDAPVSTPLPTPGPTATLSPPDLEVSKDASVNPAIVNVPFIYTIDVINRADDSNATGVQLVDALPDGFTFIDSPSHGPDCTASGSPPTVTCELGDIEGGGFTTVQLEVSAGTAADDVTNTASVHYPGDPTPSNNVGSVTIDVVEPQSNTTLTISKGASASLIAVGDELIYSISVVNNGLADAENVQVTDDVPGGMTINPVTSSQGSCSAAGSIVTCDLGTIVRNGSATITIRVTTTQEGNFTNTAVVDADNADEVQSEPVDVQVQNLADLGVTKSASQNPGVDEDMTYTLSVVNNGPANASGVTVVDSLPPSVNFTSATPSQGSCSESGNVVTCNLGGIADGAGVTINIVVVPTAEGAITNSVSVQGAEDDPYAPNDTFTLDTVVQARADLSLNKDGPTFAVAGETIRYDITVQNLGPSTAQGVFVNDTLPPNVSFVAAATAGSSQSTCSGSNSAVSCALGSIPNGGVVEIDIWIIPRLGGEITNSATVTSNTIDPDLSNNTDSTDTTVDGTQPYIILDPICGAAGETITIYGYSWQNGGSYRDIEIFFDDVLVDTIPRPTSTSWTYVLTIPAGTADGDYQVQAHQLRNGQAGIWSSENVFATIPCPAPNLIISRPQLVSGTPVEAGEPVVFSAEVTNIGNLDAVSQFFAGLYFDPSPAPTASDTHISQGYREAIVALNGLAMGASKPVTFTVEGGFSGAGTHQVYGVADSDPGPLGVITTERVETDNISLPRQVSVGAAPTATPTATSTGTPGPSATPGPSPTPTVTPTPGPTQQTGGLVVSVNNEEGQPQANTEITVIDEASGTEVATAYSDINGTHFFQTLPPATYTVTACIIIENDDYYAFVTGVVVSPGAVTQRVLFLAPAPGGCT